MVRLRGRYRRWRSASTIGSHHRHGRAVLVVVGAKVAAAGRMVMALV
ncbi:MAG: hypothetical protein IPO38_08515 [Rhodocyclaceae bacterium]|nr:hypothetical protein [Rhodocyclaceae bacterium]